MPQQKDLKRLVRARMQKTGESYTTARLHVVEKPERPDYAKLAGMSDAAVSKATGSNWEQWVQLLDRAGAREMSHRELAAHIREAHGTPSWWTQTVAVGYERIRGLRAHGQQRTGEWTVTKSKTIAVPVARLFAAFHDSRTRAKWLTGGKLTIRKSTPGKSIRAQWEDGSPLDIGFSSRGESKSQVALEQRKLASKADAERMRAFWGERLDALAAMLTE